MIRKKTRSPPLMLFQSIGALPAFLCMQTVTVWVSYGYESYNTAEVYYTKLRSHL